MTSVLNPWNVLHHAGGSSGGSGAALAARLTPVATCEDTGGSCRLPASATGVVGMRTSLGCYDVADGLLPFGVTRDTIGPMARNMDDLILLDSILRASNKTTRGNHAIPAPGVSCAAPINRNFSLEGISIGLPTDYWMDTTVTGGLDPAIMPVLDEAIAKMEEAGINIVYVNMSEVLTFPGNTYQSASWFQPAREAARYLYTHNYTKLTVNELYGQVNNPSVFKLVYPALSQGVDTPEGNVDAFFDYISTDRPAYVQGWHDTYTDNNLTALFWPTSFTENRQIDMVDPNTMLGNGSIGPVFSTAGTGDDSNAVQTALTIPIGFSRNGLPVGGNFVMPLGSEGTLMSMGLALEELFGRFPAPPTPGCLGCTANITNQTVGPPPLCLKCAASTPR
ncbi:hypothetical protein WJX73_003302 [Symbiochloris irregularis]|uniref:Amidase domain-containing protein n=1 Tax=Symbiochloris irregularis TaxID=706552 RepID=A0AAW1NVJ3_9CHLO